MFSTQPNKKIKTIFRFYIAAKDFLLKSEPFSSSILDKKKE